LDVAVCVCAVVSLGFGNVVGRQTNDADARVRYLADETFPPRPEIAQEAKAATALFTRWLQPRALDELILEEIPWYVPRGPAAGRVLVPRKTLASRDDRAPSRAVIAGLAELHLPTGQHDLVLTEGIRQYAATRAINDQLAGAHYFTVDYFGGFVTRVIRVVPWWRRPQDPRPMIRRFPELSHNPATQRVVDAMHTLERYVGWPAIQYAVTDWLQSPNRSMSDLNDSLFRATAHDLRWFTSQAFDSSFQYDYSIRDLRTAAAADQDGWHETSVVVARRGAGSFPIDVDVIFGDGTRVRERWDGRGETVTFNYSSRATAVGAIVDPELVLLLDDVRANNTLMGTPPVNESTIRWTMQWAIWLQDVLLAATALI
jgi:hypothetical protein